jgi:hypothetical protein
MKFGWRIVRSPRGACPDCGTRGDYYSQLTNFFYDTPAARTRAEWQWYERQEKYWDEVFARHIQTESELLAVIADLRARANVSETAGELCAAARAYNSLVGASVAERMETMS